MSSDSVKKPQRDATRAPLEDLQPLKPSPEDETTVKGGIGKAFGGPIKSVAPIVLKE